MTAEKPIRAALYARVSTQDQTLENQLPALRDYAAARGWEVVAEFTDEASGADASRPGRAKLLEAAKSRAVDAVLVYRLDRFGRSTRDLVNTWAELDDLGVRFVSLTEQMDFGSPAGKVMFSVISAMAEFERDLISERVRRGMKTAKARGRHLGRPASVPAVEVRRRLRAGQSPTAIAKALQISRSSVYNHRQ